jgi:hypothetical protein
MTHHNIVIGAENNSLAPNAETPKVFFITCRPTCPLTLDRRFVWSYLVKGAKQERAITQTEIRQTGLSDNTVRDALIDLLRIGLARRNDYRSFAAAEPKIKDWFVSRKAESDTWWDQLAYFVVECDPDLRPIQNVVLGLLRSLAEKDVVSRQSYSGLAKMLGCERRAIQRSLSGGTYTEYRVQDGKRIRVERTLSGLVQLGFAEVQPLTITRYGTPHRFDVLLKPVPAKQEIPHVLNPAPAIEPPVQPPAPIIAKTPVAERFPGFRGLEQKEQMVRAMDKCCYPDHLIKEVLHVVYNKLGGGNDWKWTTFIDRLKAANATHQENRKRGTYRNVKHSGHLLLSRLEDIVVQQRKDQRELYDGMDGMDIARCAL